MRIITSLIVLILICTENANCQSVNAEKVKSLIVSYENLSSEMAKYELEYVENKNTLIFKYELSNSEELGYKAILTDIHPEGIFIIELNGRNFLRILSIDNGSRFIKEKFRNGFRLSNTTNIVDIEIIENGDSAKIDKVISDLKSLLEKKKIEPEEIQSFEMKSNGN